MELRHLRYFTAVVEAKGYREASRRLHIAQPALSQTVSDLEQELALELFVRKGANILLTPAGEVFYEEAKRTLEQAEHAKRAAKRADEGKTGSLAIGFIPTATQHFLSELIHTFRQQNSGIELTVQELTPAGQMDAFAKGELDVGFTRDVSTSQKVLFSSRLLFCVPLMAVLPASRTVRDGRIQLKELAHDRFILLDRSESPPLFDSIMELCHNAGFAPQFDSQAHLVESILMLVRAEEGVSIAPAWARAVSTEGIQFVELLPCTAEAELVLLWKRDSPSVVLRSFLALVESQLPHIQELTDREFGKLAVR